MYSIGGSSCNKNSASCEISAKKMLPGFVRKTLPIGTIAFSDSNPVLICTFPDFYFLRVVDMVALFLKR